MPVGTPHRGKMGEEEEGGEGRGRRLWQVYLVEHLRYVSAES